MDLKGKVAYITGGTKGIGYGVAKVLIDQGMKVAISGRDAETAKQAATALGGSDVVIGLASNVGVLEDEIMAVNEIISKWGQLDVVLANAGVGHFAPIDELEIDKWKQMIDTN